MVSALMFQLTRWRERVLNTHPDHARIAWGVARVSAFVLVGKLAGALKEMAIAYKYGISNIVDAYQFTNTIVNWLPNTLLTVAGVVLVPMFVDLRSHKNDELAQFVGELEGASAVSGLLFAIALYLCWPFVMREMGGDVPLPTRDMSREMMYWLAPTGVLTLGAAIYAARLQANERHVNTLLEGLPAAVILVSVLVAPPDSGIVPLVFGTVVGLGLQMLWLRSIARRVDGVSSRVSLSMRSPHLAEAWRSMRTLMVGQIAVCFAAPLDQYLVASLGEGSSSTLAYANRVLALLLSMGAMAAARATLPIFSDIRRQGEVARARRTALIWSLATLAAGLACAVVSWLLAPTVIAVLFQRGAFTPEDTLRVASAFRWGLLQVPFYFALLVVWQLFASEGRFKLVANISLLAFAVKVVGNFVLVRQFGIAGVQISTAMMYASAFVLAISMLRGNRATRYGGKVR
jgi:peptidoglycan biosynthesis protein MviN/MurJ (putative lipid II flippase)